MILAKIVNNLKELEAFLSEVISETLADDVAKEVTQVMVEDGGIIDREVYNTYIPQDYRRTYQLKNPNNIETKMIDDNTLSIRSIRKDGNKDVAAVIEYGEGYTWGITRNLDKEIGARPFHKKTKEELENTKRHVEAMRKGLKKRLGNDVVV